jgi:hypothetical protein
MRLTRHAIVAAMMVLAGLLSQPAAAAEFWVAPGGADANPGTRDKPVASPALALRKARELRRLAKEPLGEPVRIILRDGVYRLDSPLLVRPEDSGSEACPTIIEAAPAARPVISGGVPAGPWRRPEGPIAGLPAAAQGHVWVADAPTFGGRIVEFRQLYVDGRKAVRAREPDGDELDRLVAWDEKGREAWIPASAVVWGQTPGVEMVLHQQWEISVLRVKSVRVEGGKAALAFQEPESKVQFDHPYPWPVMSPKGNAPYFMANAIEFLDTPGEWYQELPSGRVVYWPRDGEGMSRAKVTVPALDALVRVEGTLDRPVRYVKFRGIAFQHTTWMRPSESGHVPLQISMYLTEAYRLTPPMTRPMNKALDNLAWTGRPPAAVTLSAADHTKFERCHLEHLASTGLDYRFGTHDDLVEGCVFRDVGGNGILVGCYNDNGLEAHEPYNPKDDREVCTRERIANNLVTDCGSEEWGCAGIGVGFANEITVEHNEVCNLPYTGISLGWGWTGMPTCLRDNRVRANHIHHVGLRMYDLAGVYSLSAQPGTVISENAIHDIRLKPYVHRPEHWYYVYLDEGSAQVTVRDNWSPEDRTFENAPSGKNTFENNGPMVSRKIKDAAGLEPAFRDLLPSADTARD